MGKLFKTAFTLIELLVVIAIIGILSGLIVVSMSGVTSSANVAKGQVFSNSLRNALMSGLVSEWKFDELSSATNGATIQDSWSGGNNGTLSTGDANDKLRTGSNCAFGKCLYFDGTDDYVNLGALNLANYSGFSVAFWVKSPSGSGIRIVGKKIDAGPWEQFLFWKNGNEQVGFFQKNSSGAQSDGVTAALANNEWTYLVGTWNGSQSNLYRNGVAGTPCSVTSLQSSAENMYLGRAHQVSSFFVGFIDDVRVFNAAIPVSLIKEQYYAGLNRLLKNGGITYSEYLDRINNLAKI